jgi:hypothetical protein
MGSDVAGMRTTAVEKGIICYQWIKTFIGVLCGLLLLPKNKTRYRQ